jgi:hypothetical protein
MKTTEIEFGKIEFGTQFFDPLTEGRYIKISDNLAEMNDERYDEYITMDLNPIDYFDSNNIVRT